MSVVSDLLEFLSEATTPFHAVAAMRARLISASFVELKAVDSARLQTGQGYFLTRNDSSIIAFRAGEPAPENGVRLIGAHTDSPNLSIKPIPVKTRHGVVQLGVDVYGGALLNPWFDRDLSIAGRVNLVNASGDLESRLVDFKRPVAIIPSLAIHLDRDANSSRSINPQRDILPVLHTLDSLVGEEGTFDFKAFLAQQICHQYPDATNFRVLDYEMSLYDCQPPGLIGVDESFIASARLDNLLSCFIGLQALLAADNQHWSVLVCTDHEEVGSASAVGAQGPMLMDFLASISSSEAVSRVLRANSLMISVDNAHAVHPNFSDKHDENHGPLINAGPVIKINRNQRYATSGRGAALIRLLGERTEVPVQSFVVRTDLGCGSTIGPISAAETGIETIDIGVPTWGMHSIRETAGSRDPVYLKNLLTGFLNRLV